MNRLAVPFILFIVLGCAESVSEPPAESAAHFEVVKLRDGVYAAIAIDGRHAAANSGIVDLGGEKILVFDTSLTPRVGRLLKQAAESLIEGDVFVVVNSNFESAHVRGNQAFEDAVIVGTTRSQQGVNETEPLRLKEDKATVSPRLKEIRRKVQNVTDDLERESLELELAYLEAIEASIDSVVPTPATVVWDYKLNFNGKARRVKIIPFGHAITESDAALWLMADSLLFSSDLLVVDRHPDMKNANLEGWRAALDSLALLDVHEVIPGHGPITDKSAIENTRRYLDMIEQAAVEVAEGRLELGDAKPSGPFDGLLRADRFHSNIEAAARSSGL